MAGVSHLLWRLTRVWLLKETLPYTDVQVREVAVGRTDVAFPAVCLRERK